MRKARKHRSVIGCELSRQLSEPAGSFGSIVRERVEGGARGVSFVLSVPIIYSVVVPDESHGIVVAREGGEGRQNGELSGYARLLRRRPRLLPCCPGAGG